MIDWVEQEFKQDPAQKTHSPWTQRGRRPVAETYLPSPPKSAIRNRPTEREAQLSPDASPDRGLPLYLLIIHVIVGATLWATSLWCWLAIAKLLEE